MSLTFAQNKENIKNHMVQFLVGEGKVSKTYFGLELGTVCRTPTRGRTKLLLDAYPDIFVVEDEKISLRLVPWQSCKDSGSCTPPETPPFSANTKQTIENLSDVPPHVFPQQASNSISVDSYDTLSHQAAWENEQQWYNQGRQHIHTPTQFTPQNPFPMYSPPASMTFPMPYDGMWGHHSQGSMVFQQPPHHQAFCQSEEYGQQFASAPYNAEMHKLAYQDMGEVKQGELCEFRPPQELAALDILSQNNGSMELAQLMSKLGFHETDQIGQRKVAHFLSECSSVTVDNGVAYMKDLSAQQQPKLVTATTGGQSSMNNYNPNPPTKQTKPSNRGQQEQEEDEKENTNNDGSATPPKQGGNQDPRDEDVPMVGAKTVRIGSIHVDNVNIQTVNLHLHVDDMNKTQIGDLVALQSQIQELFQALSNNQ
eukprot:TRINITY_DN2728_c0_g1_i1.p1 TRINITY_DN2728_c0_g1~~TRINITY_DN2728_c0_g1_i1.p1  ORF type:complete len:425 (-),score=62.38 TRINITY_DN2728_c0_g1_i1:1070-2344(-)